MDRCVQTVISDARAPTGYATAKMAEITAILSFATGEPQWRLGKHPQDRSYLAKLVAARTGLSQADAEKRVDEVVVSARQALDAARRAAAQLALWLAASMFIGAFAASLAAIEGGQLRDGVWDRSWRGRRPYQTHAHT